MEPGVHEEGVAARVVCGPCAGEGHRWEEDNVPGLRVCFDPPPPPPKPGAQGRGRKLAVCLFSPAKFLRPLLSSLDFYRRNSQANNDFKYFYG